MLSLTQIVAKKIASKYKFASNPLVDKLIANLKKDIDVLYNYPHKTFDVIEACADSGVSKASDPNEKIAFHGYKFCQKLVNLIDELKANKETYTLGDIKAQLLAIHNLILFNQDIKFSEKGNPKEGGDSIPVQFPHVSMLLNYVIPVRRKPDITFRQQQQQKARTGLAKIANFTGSMLKNIYELEIMVPEKFVTDKNVEFEHEGLEVITPERGEVSKHDIIDFIREHGQKIGINSKEDWEKLLQEAPQLKEELSTEINKSTRKKHYEGPFWLKDRIKTILDKYSTKD